MLKFFGMTIVAAGLALGQGATYEGMSMFAQKSYDGVDREVQDGNRTTTQHGMLNFDSQNKVSFVAEDGAELRIPYKAIKALDYSFYNPIQEQREPSSSKSSRFVPKLPKFHKVGGKRYLTVRYESAKGLESTVLSLEPDRYARVLATFTAKTGLPIGRTGMESQF